MTLRLIWTKVLGFSRTWVLYLSMYAGAVGTVAILVVTFLGFALSALIGSIPLRGNWHATALWWVKSTASPETALEDAVEYFAVVLMLVPLSWLVLAVMAIVPGIVIGLVYEWLNRGFPGQWLVRWLIYAMASVAALPSSVLATQAQFEYVPYIWVVGSLIIGIATVHLTLQHRSNLHETPRFA